jgi:hypothetical protein
MSDITGDDDWADGIPDRRGNASVRTENSWQELDDNDSSYDPSFVGKLKPYLRFGIYQVLSIFDLKFEMN